MKSIAINRSVGKPIRILEGEKITVGIDVHKKTYSVALWSVDRQQLIRAWVQPSDHRALASKLQSVRPAIQQMVYEAGSSGFCLARDLKESQFPVKVIAPSHTPKVPGKKAKSDRVDCRKLGEYEAKGILHEVYIPTSEEESDRQVMRLRDQLMENQRRIKLQIKSFLLFHGLAEPPGLDHWSKASIQALREMTLGEDLRFVLDMDLDELEHVRKMVARATRRVHEMARRPRYQENVQRARTMKGVGLLTAMTILTEMPNPERFHLPRQVAMMAGLAPAVRESGETHHECGREEGGNRRLRSTLIEAAWQWMRRDPAAAALYRRLLANTGSKKKAIVGVARHLIIIQWRMLTRKEPYREAPPKGAGRKPTAKAKKTAKAGAARSAA